MGDGGGATLKGKLTMDIIIQRRHSTLFKPPIQLETHAQETSFC